MAASNLESAGLRYQNILTGNAKAIRKNIVAHPPKPGLDTKTEKVNSAMPLATSRS